MEEWWLLQPLNSIQVSNVDILFAVSNPRLGPADSNLTQGIQHMEYKTAISSGMMGMTQPNTGSFISPSLQPIVIGNKSEMNYKIVYSVLFVLATSVSTMTSAIMFSEFFWSRIDK